MEAALNNHPDYIPLLIKETQMQDIDGYTALMFAAYYGYKESVEILAKHEIGIVDGRK